MTISLEGNRDTRDRIHLMAYAVICATKGAGVSNKTLAKILDVDPRGLRQSMQRCPEFIIELRGLPYRTEPWYLINQNRPPIIPEVKSRLDYELQETVICKGGDEIYEPHPTRPYRSPTAS